MFAFCLPLLASCVFRISHLNALLQFKDPESPRSPFFTITAEGSCVNWTSLNPQVVRVVPHFDTPRCSHSALVEVVATGPKRKATAIIAETPSGSSLKCDVFVDAIHNVSILTTTKSIYVESSLETLSLQARDSENNIFTSLEGIDVNWTIDERHLKTIAAEDAKVLLPGISPNKSAALIVQGTQVGRTWASAVVGGRTRAKVDLVVVEPIALFPSPVVRTLPFHHIPFKLCSTRVSYDGNMEMKCVEQVKLPSSNYRVETSKDSVLTATQAAYATTHNVGTATISAVGTVLEDNGASCYVIVDYPYRVEQPEQYIALGDDPVFNPVLFDKEGHKFDLFEPVKWNISGDWSTVGRKEVRLTYHRYSFTAIVFVVPPIALDPEEAVLPVGYDGFPVKVTGGSGEYSFSVENEHVISYVNKRVKALAEGVSLIRVQDRRIAKYTASATIIVSRVGSIGIELEKRELLVGSSFAPKCDVYAKNNKRFSVPVPSKTVSDQSSIVASSMRGNSPGFANVYCECDGVESRKILVSVADSPRVKLAGRASPDSVIPLGLSGGVLQWPGCTSPVITIDCPGANATVFDDGKSFAVDREYSGVCRLKMKNLAVEKNPIPLEVETSFQLECSIVSKLVLHVVDKQASQVKECNTPPIEVTTARNAYRIVPGRVHELFVFAHDRADRIVNYYSAVKFTLSTNFSEVIKPMENRGINGETKYQFTPNNSTDLLLVSPDLGTSTVSLSAIPPFIVTPTQTVYYKKGENYSFDVEGGSGIFGTTAHDAMIGKGRLIVSPSGPGEWKYSLTDKCRSQRIDVELQALSVTRLQIVTPSIVEVGSIFKPSVRAYNDSYLIPQRFLKEAGLNMKPDKAEKIDVDKWQVQAEKIGKMTLEASAANGVKATAYIDVIDQLRIEPQHIVMLPGDSIEVKIVSGPTDVSFDCGDNTIARMNGLEIVGVAPGKVTVNVTSKHFSSLGAFPIYVHVLTPLALHIQPSTQYIIEGGHLGLSLFVETEIGLLRARKGQWNVRSSFNWKQHNASFIFINCSNEGELAVKSDAYGLTTSYNTVVEPKLELSSPSALTLPVKSSMQIELTKKLQCVYTSLNEEIVTCSNGVLRTGEVEGEAVVVIKYGHQTIALTVMVSRPAFLHVSQSPPADFQLMLLDPFGRQYHTLGGVSIALTGPAGFNSSALDSNGFCRSDYASSKNLALRASASNELFQLETSINVSVSIRITPENPIVMKGASMTVQCTAAKPLWTVSDNHTVYVDQHGLVIGRAPGKVILYCGKAAETYLTVVEITGLQLTTHSNDMYAIKTMFSSPISDPDLIAMPPDLKYSCEWVSLGCGTAKHVSNSSGHFCVLERAPGKRCRDRTILKATVTSETTKLHKSTDFAIEYTGTVNFGMPNKNKFVVTDTNRKVHLPIIIPPKDLKITAPRGLTVDTTMALQDGGIIIRADDSFRTSGLVIIEHKATGERVGVEIIHESTTTEDSAVVHEREFKITNDIWFYLCLILLFVFIFFIVRMAVYCSDE